MVHIALSILFVSQPVKKPAPKPSPPSVVLQIPASIAPLDYQPFPYSPIGTFANPYPLGQCTEGVASMKGNIPRWGNAADWAARAAADGYKVSDVPIVGSVAQKGGGEGHVAVVIAVLDNQVKVTEQNYDWNGSIRDHWYPTSTFNYIYI